MLVDGVFIHIDSDAQYVKIVKALDRQLQEYVPLGHGEHGFLIYHDELERITDYRYCLATIQSSYAWKLTDPTNNRYTI